MVDADSIRVPVLGDTADFDRKMDKVERRKKDAEKETRSPFKPAAIGGAVGGYVGALVGSVEQGTLGVLLEAMAGVFIVLFWPLIRDNLPLILAAVQWLTNNIGPIIGGITTWFATTLIPWFDQHLKPVLEGIFNFLTGNKGKPTAGDYLGGIVVGALASGAAGAAIGAGVGSVVPGVGTLAGAAVGGAAGALVGGFAGWAEVDGRTQAWLNNNPPQAPMDADVEFRIGGWRSPDAILAGGG